MVPFLSLIRMSSMEFTPVTKDEVIRNGVLGSIFGSLQISRWVILRKLTWKERLKALLFGRLTVMETYSSDQPEIRSYNARIG